MRGAENIREAAILRPDYMGFIYYRKSPRYVGDNFKPVWGPEMEGVRKTAVFVNEPLESVQEIVNCLQFEAVQLHGEESPAYCGELKQAGMEVLKAFGIAPGFDFRQLEAYEQVADFFLFDAKTSAYGGSGKSFAWEQLMEYTGSKPFFLSGGLDTDNVKLAVDAAAELPLYALDLNSRFESAPGVKNIQKLTEAIRLIKQP
ncbi:phosphoribosylanthranilate isomerase [Anseongella ginsenosidimutans]|uniref:N-(5'-phosphoribosyl)anthranilate isomerase n=2 Tax=Anseongella ginsenosidimutans TaxID=496056 RepID=A0A4R3KS21_9SPHI|nr:phosphoribosylanthranilate isomerase [Anseongella ginsenosidimutans]